MECINFKKVIAAVESTAATRGLKDAATLFAVKYYDGMCFYCPAVVVKFAAAVESTGFDDYFAKVAEAADEALKSDTAEFKPVLERFRDAAYAVHNEILNNALVTNTSTKAAYKRAFPRVAA